MEHNEVVAKLAVLRTRIGSEGTTATEAAVTLKTMWAISEAVKLTIKDTELRFLSLTTLGESVAGVVHTEPEGTEKWDGAEMLTRILALSINDEEILAATHENMQTAFNFTGSKKWLTKGLTALKVPWTDLLTRNDPTAKAVKVKSD